ncbi:MAG: DUF655 domain-containing protein [Candidatus Aenigmatarchaeota archaeon]
MPKEKKDENGIVLDFMPEGKMSDSRSEPTAQVLGDKYFSLLEVILRDGVEVEEGEKVYIGDGKRDKVKYIKKSITVPDLSTVGKEELDERLDELIEENEDMFVEFFNNAGPITPRMHQLEALPSVGKKHMWNVLDERKVEEFESLEDLKDRVPLLPDPEKIIKERIMDELDGEVKHYLFTVPKNED